MLFLTNTTISLIASVLIFLTKNTLCSATQKTNTQKNPDLQNSSQTNQRKEGENLAGDLKNMMFSEFGNLKDETKGFSEGFEGQIKEIKEEYKELKNQKNNIIKKNHGKKRPLMKILFWGGVILCVLLVVILLIVI